MAEILFLTELVGLRVFDLKRRPIGRIKDAALVPVIHPSRIDRFLIGGGAAWFAIRHDQVEEITLDGIQLKDEKLTPYHADEYMLRMVRDLLDQQIIDAQGRKVVRVTDMTFEIRPLPGQAALYIQDVDIGLRSVFRRLAEGVLPRRWIRRLQEPIPPNSIRWEYCNILETDPQRRVRLNIQTDALNRMHPADLADIVEELGPEDREAIMSSLDAEVAAETLSEVEPEMQAQILESLETEVAADIVEEMDPDEAADVLTELEPETAGEILAEMEPESKTEVRELLEFEEDTAGGLMNTEFVVIPETATVAEALLALRANEEQLETLNTLFLADDRDRLTAAVPLGRLFLARDSQQLKELASGDLISVGLDVKQDRVIERFDKYNLITLPVVDEDGRLAGVITADDVIALLREK